MQNKYCVALQKLKD